MAEGTLRMWERRYRFPEHQRLASGHRRYSQEQAELVQQVAAARAGGLSLAVAIERAMRQRGTSSGSLYAALRRGHPQLEPLRITKRMLLALSHAIEDESLARAGGQQVLFGCFQRARFYRHQRPRWRELSRGAVLAAVFADFPRLRTPHDGPIEVPVDAAEPLAREWAVVCDAEGHAVCLVGREPASSSAGASSVHRAFETVWSVDPEIVRDAVGLCMRMLPELPSALLDPVHERLSRALTAPTRDQLRLATAITNRTLSYAAGPD